MRHSEMSKPFLAILILLPIVALAAGCYTVLQHPAGPEVVNDAGQRDCYDCHKDAAAHNFDPFYSGEFQYYPDRWYPYYGRPWWWQDYWYFPPTDGPDGVAVETGRRHLWNRGDADLNLPPPAPQVPGLPGASTPGAPAAPPDDGTVRTETKKTGEDKGKTEKKEKDKKDEDKKRHLWDR